MHALIVVAAVYSTLGYRNVLIIEPVKNNDFSWMKTFCFIWWCMGIIKEGVLTEAGSIIRTLTVLYYGYTCSYFRSRVGLLRLAPQCVA